MCNNLPPDHTIWQQDAALDALGAVLTLAVDVAATAGDNEMVWLCAEVKARINKRRGRLRRLADCGQRSL